MYDHQPDFPSLRIAARPDNDQADSEPIVLVADCVCGAKDGWESSVYAGTWRGDLRKGHTDLRQGDQAGTLPAGQAGGP